MATSNPPRVSWNEPFELRSLHGHDWAGPIQKCRVLGLVALVGMSCVAFVVEPKGDYSRSVIVGLAVVLGAVIAFGLPRMAASAGTNFEIDSAGIVCYFGAPLAGWCRSFHYSWTDVFSLRIVREATDAREFRVLIISGPGDNVLRRAGLRDNVQRCVQQWAEAQGVTFTDEVGEKRLRTRPLERTRLSEDEVREKVKKMIHPDSELGLIHFSANYARTGRRLWSAAVFTPDTIPDLQLFTILIDDTTGEVVDTV